MIKPKRLFVAMMLAGLPFASSATSEMPNFNYRILGDKTVAPVQVFDSNGDTYIQLRSGMEPPSVFDPAGHVVNFSRDEPYIVIKGVHDGLVLHYGKREAKILNSQAAISAIFERVNGVNLWYGQAPTLRQTGSASEPVPAADNMWRRKPAAPKKTDPAPVVAPAQVAAIPVVQPAPQKPVENVDAKRTMIGAFTVQGTGSKKMVVGDSGLAISTGEGVSTQDVVLLYKYVQSQGVGSKFKVTSGLSARSKSTASMVRARLVGMSVPDANIRLVESAGLNDMAVVVAKDEK